MLPGWVVAVTQPQAEAKAVAKVGKLGYEVFYPKTVRRIRYHGRRISIMRPLFPGYFFTWLLPWNWSDLLRVSGVTGLLMNGDKLAVVHEDIMKELKSRCDRNGVCLDDVRKSYEKGQKVRIQVGYFAGKIGSFEGFIGQREAVLIDVLGAKRRVLFDEGALITA